MSLEPNDQLSEKYDELPEKSIFLGENTQKNSVADVPPKPADLIKALGYPLLLQAFQVDVKSGGRAKYVTNDEELKEALKYMKGLNDQCWNIYYELNSGPGRKNDGGYTIRHNEATIDRIRGICGDVDVKNGATWEGCLEAIRKLPLPPSYIVMTGGGYQPGYLMHKPVEATLLNRSMAKAAGVGLAVLLRGAEALKREIEEATAEGKKSPVDAVASLEHLFRLPGFKNRPDAKKRARGREPVKAKLIEFSEHRYSLEELAATFGKHAEEVLGHTTPAGNGTSQVDLSVNDDLAAGIDRGPWDALSPEDKDKYLAEMLQVPSVVALADTSDSDKPNWHLGLAACARSGAPNAMELCRAWAKTSKRFSSDFGPRYRSYLKTSGRDKETSIGSLIDLAKAGGWTAPWLRDAQEGAGGASDDERSESGPGTGKTERVALRRA